MSSRGYQCGAVRFITIIGWSSGDIGRSGGSVIDGAGRGGRSGRSLATGAVPDGGSRRSESIEIISVVEVEMLKIVVHVVGCWESDGIGWDDVAGRLDIGLDAVRVDLGVIGVVHGNNLVSDEVGTDTQQGFSRRAERTYPDAISVGIWKVQALVREMVSDANSFPSQPASEILNH
jgi:hypothetical protein